MAVTTQNIKAKLLLTDENRKQLCSFSDVDPSISAEDITLFVTGINSLRKDSVEYTYIVIESELTDGTTGA